MNPIAVQATKLDNHPSTDHEQSIFFDLIWLNFNFRMWPAITVGHVQTSNVRSIGFSFASSGQGLSILTWQGQSDSHDSAHGLLSMWNDLSTGVLLQDNFSQFYRHGMLSRQGPSEIDDRAFCCAAVGRSRTGVPMWPVASRTFAGILSPDGCRWVAAAGSIHCSRSMVVCILCSVHSGIALVAYSSVPAGDGCPWACG